MKAFYRKTVASCLSLVVLFLTIGPAAAANVAIASVVEIRGPVYNGSSITDILTNTAYGDGTILTMDATQFAGFYYDPNDDTNGNISIKPDQP